ncbi:MAG TPA: maleylacetate reductase [Solirubrobacterales bacterium]
MTGGRIEAGTRFAVETPPGRVLFGAGCLDSVPAELERLGRARALLIAGPAAERPAAQLVSLLGSVLAGRFVAVRPHVPAAVGAEAVATTRRFEADCLIALGGGSAIGTAKAVARKTGIPIVAVPTTYSGSEMTPVWGETDAGRKTTGRDPAVLPKVVVYDPELTLSMPAALTAASGMNALAHAVEALWAPGRNPVTALLAEAAIGELAEALPGAVEHPADLDCRSAALFGAHLAGSAFAVTGSGLHHRICHVLGGSFDLPHAQTHAIVLPQVVAFQEPAATGSTTRLAALLGSGSRTPAAALYDLAEGMGLPRALRDLGLPEERLWEAIPAILEKAPPDNPRPVDADGVRLILEGALEGRRP